MTYKPGGKLVNHPRAANFVRKLTEGPYKGCYIYWFHNHAGKSYQGRNPAYLLGGVEVDSPAGKIIQWGQPLAVLKSDNKRVRISYPDFIWDKEALYISETQKTLARIHRIPDALLKKLWQKKSTKTAPASHHGDWKIDSAVAIKDYKRSPQFTKIPRAYQKRQLKVVSAAYKSTKIKISDDQMVITYVYEGTKITRSMNLLSIQKSPDTGESHAEYYLKENNRKDSMIFSSLKEKAVLYYGLFPLGPEAQLLVLKKK